MLIREVARKLNISTRTIRFYEEKGLISPHARDGNRYRRYTDEEVWRLQTIVSLREIGMGLHEIKQAIGEAGPLDKERLLSYLEIQRAATYATWLAYKRQIAVTDEAIELLKTERSLPLDRLNELAEGSKRLREIRGGWRDRWNFDLRASAHDDIVEANDGVYEHYDRALDTVVGWIDPKSGERGLDIGTGTGNLAGRFAARGYAMAAVDQSAEMLKQCRGKFPQLETKLGNFLAIPFMDGSFDYAVSSFALHHLTGAQQMLALDELKRVLKPKGRICIADFMFEDGQAKRSFLQAMKAVDDRYGIQTAGERSYADLSQLCDWFERHGYITKMKQLSDVAHVIYAVPIR